MNKRGPKPFRFGDFCRRGHQLSESTVCYEMNSGIRRMRCAVCRRASTAARYKSNPEVARKAKIRARAWYAQHRHMESFKSKKRMYAQTDRARAMARDAHKRWRLANQRELRAYYEANRERFFKKWREHAYRQVENLGDSYVAARLGFTLECAPPELIAAKREHLRVLRLLKEI